MSKNSYSRQTILYKTLCYSSAKDETDRQTDQAKSHVFNEITLEISVHIFTLSFLLLMKSNWRQLQIYSPIAACQFHWCTVCKIQIHHSIQTIIIDVQSHLLGLFHLSFFSI